MTPSEIIKAAEELAESMEAAAEFMEGTEDEFGHKKDALIVRSLIALVPGEGINHRELIAIEFGYRQCEKGLSIESTFTKFRETLQVVKEKP